MFLKEAKFFSLISKHNYSMSNQIIVNDKLVESNIFMIPYQNRGFLYGDGIFETCKVIERRIVNYSNHFQRLKDGLDYLKIKVDLEKVFSNAKILINTNNLINGLVRISISRADGSIGYLPIDLNNHNIIIETKDNYQINNSIELGISYRNPAGFFFKSHSALSYVLTSIDANQNGFFDNIMINQNQQVCETSKANIFWYKNQKLYTAHENLGIVKGCIRKKIIDLNLFDIVETYANLTDLVDSDEIIITNSNFLAVNVKKITISPSHYYQYSNNKITNLINQKLAIINHDYY
jgi:branched-subunit amino acid aminotransferase/4-amino-4-deoxychorismate lyase